MSELPDQLDSDGLEPALAGAKRQHYVAEWHLEQFVGTDGCVAVFDRITGLVRRQKPVNTAVVGHLYTYTDEQDRRRYDLEVAIGKIEGLAARLVQDLLGGKSLDTEGRSALSYYFALQAVRTPDFIDSLQHAAGELHRLSLLHTFGDLDRALAAVREWPACSGKDEEEVRRLADRAMAFVGDPNFEIEADRQRAVATSIELADTIAPTFFDRNWTIVSAPEGEALVTADCGVALTSLRPRVGVHPSPGYKSKDALVYVPLSSIHGLAMWGNDQVVSTQTLSMERCERFNLLISSHAQRFVFARDNEKAAIIGNSAGLTKREWKPSFTVK